MSKVLFFARDPGAANCLIPVIRKMRGSYDCVVYAKDTALTRIRSAGIDAKDFREYGVSDDTGSVRDFIGKTGCDVVVTGTSVDDHTERYMWTACRELSVPSVAVIDQWTNLGIRFSRYGYLQEDEYRNDPSHDFLPDKICVMDELARRMIVGEGIDDSLVAVTGQPHFDTVKADFDRAVCPAGSGTVITFVSEPIFRDYDDLGRTNYWGFNEYSIFRELVAAVKKCGMLSGKDDMIIIRPHPRENPEKWEEELANTDGINVGIDNRTDTYTLLKKSSLVCGMSSMMLLEAAICGVPIMSIMIGLKRENPFVLSNIGLCPTITDSAVLAERLDSFLKSGFAKTEQFSYIENAAEHVTDCIKEVLKNGKTGS